MSSLLKTARGEYDLVVIDTPPIVVADAIALMPQVSGVLVVSRLNQSRRDAARDLRELLANLDVLPLGTVANDTAPRGRGITCRMPVAPAPRPDVAALRTLRAPARFEFGAAACASLLVAAALIKLPLLAVAAVGILVLGTTMGIEALIVVFVLGACGVLPFVRCGHVRQRPGQGLCVLLPARARGDARRIRLARACRQGQLAPRRRTSCRSASSPCSPTSSVVALGSHPSEVPSLAAPFAILPLSGLAVILWLSHDDALQGLRRVLPLAS